MGKRMTGTTKWDKRWFRSLEPRVKLLWVYILDKCDQAGVWDGDFGIATYVIGQEVSEVDLEAFEGRVEHLDSGKYWVIDFVKFQCVTLSATSPAHKPIFKLLAKHGLLDRVLNNVEIHQPRVSVVPETYTEINSTKRSRTSEGAVSKEEVIENILNDEQFVDSLKMSAGRDKNILEAFEECYLYHTNKPNPPTETWQWRQKLITWLSIKRKENATTNKREQNTSSLVKGFAERHG